MAGEEKLKFSKFLADVLDKTEILFENFEPEVVEAHAEVPDQSCRFCRCKLAIFFMWQTHLFKSCVC